MKRNKFIVLIIMSIFSILLFSCSSPKTKSLLDLKDYNNLNMKKIVRVDVEWDVNESEPIEFSINNEIDIKYIVKQLSRKDEFKTDKRNFDSGHSRLYLIDDSDNKTIVSLICVYDRGVPYYYTNTDLYSFIRNYGIKLGLLS